MTATKKNPVEPLEDVAIGMARDLADGSLARRIVMDVVDEVRAIPEPDRAAAVPKLLKSRLLKETVDFAERLNSKIESTLRTLGALLNKPKE